MEHNLSYKPIYELFQAKDNDNLIFTNYYNRENVEKVVIFQSRKDYCYDTYFLIYFEAKISGTKVTDFKKYIFINFTI